jgi:hypothetical protein
MQQPSRREEFYFLLFENEVSFVTSRAKEFVISVRNAEKIRAPDCR